MRTQWRLRFRGAGNYPAGSRRFDYRWRALFSPIRGRTGQSLNQRAGPVMALGRAGQAGVAGTVGHRSQILTVADTEFREHPVEMAFHRPQ